MDDLQAAIDPAVHHLIAMLLTEFCWRADNGEAARIGELFTEDATMVTPHFALNGRAEIHARFAGRPPPSARPTQHMWSNLRVTRDGPDAYLAEASSVTLVGTAPLPANGALLSAGVTIDRVVIDGGAAKFASRRLDVRFEGRILGEESKA